MAGQWGGYRKPTHPAPVSGPGAHSRRTDGQPVADMPDAAYGENASFREIQGGAQMAQAQPVPNATQGGALAALVSGLTGMGAPTGRPDVPVTDGADAGPGAGSSALGLPTEDPNRRDAAYLAKHLPVLLELASDDNAPPGFKGWVRQVFAYS